MAMSATFCRRDLSFGFGFESVVVEERVCGRFGPISFLFFLFGSAIYVLISLLFCLVFFFSLAALLFPPCGWSVVAHRGIARHVAPNRPG